MNRWTDILNHTKVIVLNEFYSIKKLNIILKNSIKKKKKKGKTLIKKIMKGSTRKRSSAIQVKHQAGVANLLIRSYDR